MPQVDTELSFEEWAARVKKIDRYSDVELELARQAWQAARREGMLEAARIAENPYSDEVAAWPGEKLSVVGKKISKAIREAALRRAGEREGKNG